MHQTSTEVKAFSLFWTFTPRWTQMGASYIAAMTFVVQHNLSQHTYRYAVRTRKTILEQFLTMPATMHLCKKKHRKMSTKVDNKGTSWKTLRKSIQKRQNKVITSALCEKNTAQQWFRTFSDMFPLPEQTKYCIQTA